MQAIHIMCFLWHWKGFQSSPTNNRPSSHAKYWHDEKHTSLRLQFSETSRTFHVRLGQMVSSISVISPVLFILALNSISEDLPRNIQHLLCADDLLVFLRHNNAAEANRGLQSAINRLAKWGAERGLIFSSAKTKILSFSRKRQQINLHLTHHNKPLDEVTQTSFLGLKFDSGLTWTSHINQLKEKCSKRLNILKVLNGSTWGSNRKCLLPLHICYIRSLMDYGSIIYSTASQSTHNQLNTIQNTAIRIATGALRTSPISSLHVEANILLLHHHRNLDFTYLNISFSGTQKSILHI